MKPLRDKGPTDNMNMKDLVDMLLMKFGLHIRMHVKFGYILKLPVWNRVIKKLEIHVIELAERCYSEGYRLLK